MRILILSQWYPPEPASKPHEMACELVKRGHRVLALTGFPNYPLGKLYPGYRQRLWQREEIDGVPVLTTRASPWQDLLTYGCGWWTDASEDAIAGALREAIEKSG